MRIAYRRAAVPLGSVEVMVIVYAYLRFSYDNTLYWAFHDICDTDTIEYRLITRFICNIF